MKAVLDRVHPDRYWEVLRNFYWYKNSAMNETAHPMITGLFRIRDRVTRRPGFRREGRFRHLWRRLPEMYRYVRGVVRLTLEFEELWLQTARGAYESRSEFARYWRDLRDRLKRGRIDVLLRIDRIALHALREARVTVGFFVALAAGNGEPKAS